MSLPPQAGFYIAAFVARTRVGSQFLPVSSDFSLQSDRFWVGSSPLTLLGGWNLRSLPRQC